MSHSQRITLKRKRPNPLFQDWLEELYVEAKTKKSKLEPMLKEALSSISKYPLPLKTGAECGILQGFHKNLCKFLDQRLEVYEFNKRTRETQNTDSNGDTILIIDEDDENIPIGEDETQSNCANINDTEISNHTNGTQPNETQTSNSINNIYKHNITPVVPERVGRGVKAPTLIINTAENNCSPRIFKTVHRSGSYAILIGLLEHLNSNPDDPNISKECLIDIAQKHSEESFIRPKPDSLYTAWSSMSTLIAKGLVKKTTKKKVLYALTDEGVTIAKHLIEFKTLHSINGFIFNNHNKKSSGAPTFCLNTPTNNEMTSESIETEEMQSHNKTDIIEMQSHNKTDIIEMQPESFDVILIVDKNETSGVTKKNDPTVAQFNKFPDLKHEYRSLKLGDFCWIARHKSEANQEFVLPYIVERKRMDDLGASIKDGRFHEQKFRLRKCGIPNVIYLIENYGKNTRVGLPIQSLMQAIANTRVQDGFKVHTTDSLTHSCRFLAMMTKRITLAYKNQTLKGSNQGASDVVLMTFNYFNNSSKKSKPMTVTEAFIKLLLQLKGVSIDKALAITKKYTTPTSLLKAYESCDTQKEKQLLLGDLKYNVTSRKVGPAVSKSLCHLFTIE